MDYFDTVLLLPHNRSLKFKQYLNFKQHLNSNKEFYTFSNDFLNMYNSKADISLIKLDRSEYGFCTGQSNLHNKQVRFFEDQHYPIYGFHFYNSDDLSEKWSLEEKELFIKVLLDVIDQRLDFCIKSCLCKMFDFEE